MEYEYKRPQGELHKVSIAKWNKTFSNRGRWPFIQAEVYLEDDAATVQYVISPAGKVFLVVAFPIFLIIGIFVCGLKEAYTDIKRAIFDKKYGSFSSDRVYKEENPSWEKLMTLVGKNQDE